MKDFKEVIEERINSYKKFNGEILEYFDSEGFYQTTDSSKMLSEDYLVNQSIIKELKLLLKLCNNGE